MQPKRIQYNVSSFEILKLLYVWMLLWHRPMEPHWQMTNASNNMKRVLNCSLACLFLSPKWDHMCSFSPKRLWVSQLVPILKVGQRAKSLIECSASKSRQKSHGIIPPTNTNFKPRDTVEESPLTALMLENFDILVLTLGLFGDRDVAILTEDAERSAGFGERPLVIGDRHGKRPGISGSEFHNDCFIS